MAIPLAVFLSYSLEEYNRQFFYTLMTNLAQIVTACILLYQQSSTKTKYFKSSITGQGILPMNKIN
jgi:hypothetical protein